jgi:Xaa-Pro aminopeptidase
MERREFLGAGAALATAGAAAATTANAAAKSRKSSVSVTTRFVDDPELGRRIPVNKERAYAVLEELGLDGIIAAQAHNVYYLTNTVTTLTLFKEEFPSFATFAKDSTQPSFLISSTGNTWETANGSREVPRNIIAMSGPVNWRDYIDATPEQMRIPPQSAGAVSPGFAFKAGAALTKREAAWKQAQETLAREAAPTAAWALQRALKESGLLKGRIAVDDMRIAWLLQSIGVDTVKIIPGDNVFRKIRLIKTADEMALMRVAQQISQEAAVTAAHALEPGMTYDQFRTRFNTEVSARGGSPGFILLGMTQGLLPDGIVKKGQSYMLDCSAHFKMYQGDFARTVMIGEPRPEAMKRFKAQQAAREACFAIIKEGVPFKTVESLARETMIKSGMPKNVPTIAMHSVGLQHGDGPTRTDVPFAVREELTLQENMTITLDLPYVEVGEGAGHNEDLLRITKTGYEILNDPREPLIVV